MFIIFLVYFFGVFILMCIIGLRIIGFVLCVFFWKLKIVVMWNVIFEEFMLWYDLKVRVVFMLIIG